MTSRVRAYLGQHHVGLIALFIALSGTAYAAVNLPNNSVGSGEIKKNAVKAPEIAKNAVRKSETAKNSVGTGEVTDGSLSRQDFAPGQLPAGEQGEPATKLFAYIKDHGATPAATLEYGSGVTGVDDPAGNSSYTVTFNRDLSNCVAQAVSGLGHPRTGDFSAGPYIPILWLASPLDEPNEVSVDFRPPSAGSNATDTSFMITAFC